MTVEWKVAIGPADMLAYELLVDGMYIGALTYYPGQLGWMFSGRKVKATSEAEAKSKALASAYRYARKQALAHRQIAAAIRAVQKV